MGLIAALAFGMGSTGREADALRSVSTLTVVDGAVFTSRGGEFTLARETDVLAAGDTVRTGAGAVAEVTYADGSSVRLEAGAELVVERRMSDPDARHSIDRVLHAVTKLFTCDSRYGVRTPSSTASVRG
jgi:hypothetical protein